MRSLMIALRWAFQWHRWSAQSQLEEGEVHIQDTQLGKDPVRGGRVFQGSNSSAANARTKIAFGGNTKTVHLNRWFKGYGPEKRYGTSPRRLKKVYAVRPMPPSLLFPMPKICSLGRLHPSRSSSPLSLCHKRAAPHPLFLFPPFVTAPTPGWRHRAGW